MKTATVALSCFTGVVVSLAAASVGGGKAATPTPGIQIGIVRAVEILQNDRKHTEEVIADRKKARAELDALAKEINAEEGELATLKTTSIDYLKQAEAVTEKTARFNAHKEFLQRQLLLKEQQWTQKMYGQIVRATREVAVEKGLALVLVQDDPNSLTQPEAASAVMATQKVLYSGGCPDITQEVQAKLSTAKP